MSKKEDNYSSNDREKVEEAYDSETLKKIKEADIYLQRYSENRNMDDFERGIKEYAGVAEALEKKGKTKLAANVYLVAGQKSQMLHEWDIAAEMYKRMKNPFMVANLYYDAVTKTEGESQKRYAEKAAEVLDSLSSSMKSISKKERAKPSKLEEEVDNGKKIAASIGVIVFSILLLTVPNITGAVIGNETVSNVIAPVILAISLSALFIFNRKRLNNR